MKIDDLNNVKIAASHFLDVTTYNCDLHTLTRFSHGLQIIELSHVLVDLRRNHQETQQLFKPLFSDCCFRKQKDERKKERTFCPSIFLNWPAFLRPAAHAKIEKHCCYCMHIKRCHGI